MIEVIQYPVQRHRIELQDDQLLPISKPGKELLSDPLLNKGTGFTTPGS
jgi:hypothetical protein